MNFYMRNALQGVKFTIINSPVFVWYLLSTSINFYGGYMLFAGMGHTAQLLSGMTLVIVQLSLPYFKYQSEVTQRSYALGKALTWLITLLCFVFTIATMVKINTANHISNTANVKSLQYNIKKEELKLETSYIPTTEELDHHKDSTREIFLKINDIKELPAKNLAGDTVYLNNKPATLWEITNNCTPTGKSSDIYINNDKLYKKHCQQIKMLFSELKSLESKNTEELRKVSISNNISTLDNLSNNVKTMGDEMAKLFNSNYVTAYVLEGVNASDNNPEYMLSKVDMINERALHIAVSIGLLGMLLEWSLMSAFILQFTTKGNTNNVRSLGNAALVYLIDKLAPAKSTQATPEIFKNSDDTFDATEWMQSFDMRMMRDIQSLAKLDSISGKIELDEILMLQQCVTHTYSAGEHLALKSTIDKIEQRLLNDKEYSIRISGKNRPLSEDSIKAICKTNRLKKFYWEIFDGILIEKIEGKYYWKSEKDIKSLHLPY